MLPRTSRTMLGFLLGSCLLAAVGVEAKPKTTPQRTTQATWDLLCETKGKYVSQVAQARDDGISLATTFRFLREQKIPTAMRPDFEHIILVVYDTPVLTPIQIRRVFENACLTSAARPQE